MTTLKDIAKYTGVSCTTVSNVIHNRPGRVSPETIKKINDAIEELGYIPNMSARSLVSNSSKVIAFINHIVIRDNCNFLDDPFHASFIGIMEDALRKEGYYLMLRTVQNANELMTFLHNWNVDGIFIMGVFQDEMYEALCKLKTPVVLIDSYVHHPNFCNVGLEDFQGSYLATKYLIEQGHRIIAFTGPPIRPGGVVEMRWRGYQQALAEANITYDSHLVFESEMDLESCDRLCEKLIVIPGLTAITSTADIMAAGLIHGLRKRNLSVPEDISVVGYDGSYLSELLNPPLTTIYQDMLKKGKTAVNYMIQKLSGKEIPQPETILPVSLIERESVKKIGTTQ